MGARAAVTAFVAFAVLATTAGCGRTVSGTAEPAGGSGVNMNFDKLLRECEVVSQPEIAKATGAQEVMGSFNGAVCMWNLVGAPGGDAMATLNWYEMGTLTTEKQNNDRLGYITTDANVQGRRSIQVQRPNDPDSCGVMAPAADTGIIGWWVNYRPGAHPNPCDPAKKLAELTLNLAR
ncbi:DUF3558 domain-containing protein [Nocardia transvalensis]|uniref:DUF3558 domain-containing protein n=1 Tax=Nocardia transvalensis TaxID=37333 RepID=UPI0018948C02|nr:DUF3558 domain-containing protein [Nocardia transvalensis]MBF6330450.1 DUF3558 domain-containing protein [Nocardia transvalensis]